MTTFTLPLKNFQQILESTQMHVNKIDFLLSDSIFHGTDFKYNVVTGALSDGEKSLKAFVQELLKTKEATVKNYWEKQQALSSLVLASIA
jgi:hypothetical protein